MRAPNMQLKSFLRLRLRHSDVASCHVYCIRNLRANFLRRLTGCYVAASTS